jgi:hypothetical protein
LLCPVLSCSIPYAFFFKFLVLFSAALHTASVEVPQLPELPRLLF